MITRTKALTTFGLAVVLSIGGSVAYRVLDKPEEVVQPAVQSPEVSVSPTASQRFRAGSFGVIDNIHKGSGRAVVYKVGDTATLRLENFTVTDGPDLYVYLSKNPKLASEKKPGEFVSLGRLQKIQGEQTYALPADLEPFTGVVIYCRAFSQTFSVAPFES